MRIYQYSIYCTRNVDQQFIEKLKKKLGAIKWYSPNLCEVYSFKEPDEFNRYFYKKLHKMIRPEYTHFREEDIVIEFKHEYITTEDVCPICAGLYEDLLDGLSGGMLYGRPNEEGQVFHLDCIEVFMRTHNKYPET